MVGTREVFLRVGGGGYRTTKMGKTEKEAKEE